MKGNGFTKTLYLIKYHLFFSQLHVISSFFYAENLFKMFIVPAVNVRMIHELHISQD